MRDLYERNEDGTKLISDVVNMRAMQGEEIRERYDVK